MYDFCVVGAGIVGLATARALNLRFPGATVVVLEKEPAVGMHQTGHNSGVLHSGLYYRPGSLKARLCVEGRRQIERLAGEAGIPFRRTGKLVVATHRREMVALEELHRRGIANGLSGLRMLAPEEISEFEPHATGVGALHVPEAGVIDFSAVAAELAARLEGTLELCSPVTAVRTVRDRLEVITPGARVETRMLINCAGLHSDRVARMAGAQVSLRIVPFRGEYYRLSAAADHLVRGLIYPVPDPRFPFLGVHFTRRVDGEVEVGPNAVPALGREHYRGVKPNWADVAEVIGYRGLWRLAGRYWRTGAAEVWHSWRRAAYARHARALVPDLQPEDLEPGGAGVRAQAVSPDGRLVDDFAVVEGERAIHLLNAPSPAATAAPAIGRHIAGLAAVRRMG